MSVTAAARSEAPQETASVRRIRRIAEIVGARRYLEVGVASGRTFNALDGFDYKVAVDPKFMFDASQHACDTVIFHEMTSDRFFLEHSDEYPFDIIFLDGLHTFGQTFRDLCNSLMLAHSRTVWLIDDVLPDDPFSAWPVQSEVREFRRHHGITSSAWHGDVYKVLLAVHDYFPLLSYVTIRDSGKPQALVWRESRRSFAPVTGSLELIERCTYFDLLKRMDLLNCASESAAFQSLATWSGSRHA